MDLGSLLKGVVAPLNFQQTSGRKEYSATYFIQSAIFWVLAIVLVGKVFGGTNIMFSSRYNG
jgi:hypothetical protein